VPGADAWRERETSMRLDPDGWLVRRNVADATIMKTRMRLRSPIGGGVCLSERNEKKCQKLCKGDVLPLDRSLLTLQRYLTQYLAQTPSSMRDVGSVIALLQVSHQPQAIIRREDFEGQDHLQ
jgi:hypothetical protein